MFSWVDVRLTRLNPASSDVTQPPEGRVSERNMGTVKPRGGRDFEFVALQSFRAILCKPILQKAQTLNCLQ